jgi:hypothetical protein
LSLAVALVGGRTATVVLALTLTVLVRRHAVVAAGVLLL